VITDKDLENISKKLVSFNKIWIGYSGGLDSTVLLYLLTQVKEKFLPKLALHSLHINHGIQKESGMWKSHCVNVCENLNVPIDVIDLNIKKEKGESLENQARQARYKVFKDFIKVNDVLLTAHHGDDRAARAVGEQNTVP